MLLKSYFKKDMIIHYRGRYTKSLHSNLEKIGASMRVDAGEVERFWEGGGKPLTKSQLQREKEKIMRQDELLYKKNFNDIRVVAAELNDNIDNISEENEESSRSEVYKPKNQDMKTSETIDNYIIKQREKPLCVTR
ncbi:hypothetical protein C2G38_2151046 [Gigaspora rosea]|uniref:Uncharacterized protein n=1 Tax=Gigaspora rosea TaxID=44941 RepID=A0A397WEA4_9GLOM|nr:hypothetical protein C2G38_2151046 [Gigaspora rosea]